MVTPVPIILPFPPFLLPVFPCHLPVFPCIVCLVYPKPALAFATVYYLPAYPHPPIIYRIPFYFVWFGSDGGEGDQAN